MKVEFVRLDEVAREERQLPSEIYNLSRLMIQASREGHVFVPIRSMQYLAVMDSEEFIFVDREASNFIEISWQRFKPGSRNSLDEPVSFDAVYYTSYAPETMRRLQGDFARALLAFSEKQEKPKGGEVLRFRRKS